MFLRCFVFFKCSFCFITHWEKKILSHCYTVSHQLLLCQMMSVLKLKTNVKYVNSSNEVPIAFILLCSISVCVKVFPKFLQKKKIWVNVEINFSFHSQTGSYLPCIFSSKFGPRFHPVTSGNAISSHQKTFFIFLWFMGEYGK